MVLLFLKKISSLLYVADCGSMWLLKYKRKREERREEKRKDNVTSQLHFFFQDVHDSLSLQLFSPSHLHQPTTPSLLCRWNETLWRACNDGRREDQLSSESNKISDPPSQPQPQLALVYTAFEGSVPMVNLDVFAIQVMTTSCRGPWRVFFRGCRPNL